MISFRNNMDPEPRHWPDKLPVILSGRALPAQHPENGSSVMLPELLKSQNIEAVFGVSGRTIRRWAKRGYLRPIRVGRSVFYDPADVRRLLLSQLSGSAQDDLVSTP